MRAHTNICKLCDRAGGGRRGSTGAAVTLSPRCTYIQQYLHIYIRIYACTYTACCDSDESKKKHFIVFKTTVSRQDANIYLYIHKYIHRIISVGCVCVCGAGVDRLSLRALSTKNVLNYSKHTMKFIGRICVSVFLCYLACSGKICTNTLGCRMRP